jgi:uncharacterized protein
MTNDNKNMMDSRKMRYRPHPGLRLCTAVIRLYQILLSPTFGGHCRFEPSCSEYAREAIERHGVMRGVRLAANRLWRCRPGLGAGDDPVPPRKVIPLRIQSKADGGLRKTPWWLKWRN